MRGTAELSIPLGATAAADPNAAPNTPPMALSLFADVGGGTVRLASTGEMGLAGGAAAGIGVRYGPFRVDQAFNLRGERKVSGKRSEARGQRSEIRESGQR